MENDSKNSHEILGELDDALSSLPEKLSEALVLHFFQGKNQRETGEILGCGEEAARKRISRGLEKLGALLRNRGIQISAIGLMTLLQTQRAGMASSVMVASIHSFVFLGYANGGASISGAIADQTLKAMDMKTMAKTTAIGLLASLVFVMVAGSGWSWRKESSSMSGNEVSPIPQTSSVTPALLSSSSAVTKSEWDPVQFEKALREILIQKGKRSEGGMSYQNFLPIASMVPLAHFDEAMEIGDRLNNRKCLGLASAIAAYRVKTNPNEILKFLNDRKKDKRTKYLLGGLWETWKDQEPWLPFRDIFRCFKSLNF